MSSAPDNVIEFVNFGVLGLVVVALIVGWIWPKPSVDRLLKDKDRLLGHQAKQIEALGQQMRELNESVQSLRNEVRRDEARRNS
jgi:hypothetical protein